MTLPIPNRRDGVSMTAVRDQITLAEIAETERCPGLYGQPVRRKPIGRSGAVNDGPAHGVAAVALDDEGHALERAGAADDIDKAQLARGGKENGDFPWIRRGMHARSLLGPLADVNA